MQQLHASVHSLHTYPVKGCRGVSQSSLNFNEAGVEGDRVFSIVHDGTVVNQVKYPQLATVTAEYDSDTRILHLSHKSHGSVTHEWRDNGRTIQSQLFLDDIPAVDQGDDVAAWLSQIVGKDVRLVATAEPWTIQFPTRLLGELNGKPKDNFFSAAHLSLGNVASLDDLNARLDHPVSMDRFRLNIVVEGLDPYDEDRIAQLVGPNINLVGVGSAERCVVTTTDQLSGDRPKNNLLQTLGAYRRREKRYASGLLFGHYLTYSTAGVLNVGDPLTLELDDRET